jgi:predicted nuclease of predicted toxin-antitoxin system
VRLLFDANLSPALVKALSDLFPGSMHVFDCGDIASDDNRIWHHARQHGFVIVAKDGDFQALSLVLGTPPKVIMLGLGTAPTAAAERLLRGNSDLIGEFESDQTAALLTLR